MLSGARFYTIYKSTHLHFTSDNFDVLKYSNRSRSILAGYDSRKDKAKFDYCGGKFNDPTMAMDFCVANFVHNDSNWIYEPFEESNAVYSSWKKYIESFTVNFKREYGVLSEILTDRNFQFKKMIEVTPSGKNPPLMQHLVQGKFTPEFISTLDQKFNFINSWYEIVKNDPFLSKEVLKLKKYGSLLNIIKTRKK